MCYERFCRKCNGEFTTHHIQIAFCSDDCRKIYSKANHKALQKRWYQENRERLKEKYRAKAEERHKRGLVCPVCNKGFIKTFRYRQTYCGEACRKIAYRKHRRNYLKRRINKIRKKYNHIKDVL